MPPRKQVEHLLGLCRGLVADRQLNEAEIVFLDAWLKENAPLMYEWPGSVLAERLRAVLADAVIDEDERKALIDTIDMVIGHVEGAPGGAATTVCDPVLAKDVVFAGRSFLFTGGSIGASRKKLKQLISELGGINASESVLFFADVRDRLPELDYLVIGSIASAAWSHGTYGTKVEYAMRARDMGAPITILSDETFWLAVRLKMRKRDAS